MNPPPSLNFKKIRKTKFIKVSQVTLFSWYTDVVWYKNQNNKKNISKMWKIKKIYEQPFKRQPHEMYKHTQTIHRQFLDLTLDTQ